MMFYVQPIMVTSIVILLIVTVTTGATGDGVHQAQQQPVVHHLHQYKLTLHQDKHHQRFDEPQSGGKIPELFHGERSVVNSNSTLREDSDQHGMHVMKLFLHPDKIWGDNSTSKNEDSFLTKPTKTESSSDSGVSSIEDHQLPEGDEYVLPRVNTNSPVHRRPELTRTIENNLESRGDVTINRKKAQTDPSHLTNAHQKNTYTLLGTKGAHTSDLEGAPCTSDTDCYLTNFNDTFYYKGSVVQPPYCKVLDNSSSEGYCTCGEYCVSRTKDSGDDHLIYYCGPCGRMGSSCSASTFCNHSLSTCTAGYCSCDSGEFYDLYYCMIPYYGYEKALQVAIATCIFVAFCLLAATIYSSIYRRRQGRIHPYLLRLLLRRANQGTRESPPGDTPPKYDDVVEQPPSYQQALELERDTEEQEGENNLAFDADNKDNNNTQDKDKDNDDNKSNNSGGDGIEDGVIVKITNTSNNIRKDSKAPDDGIFISIVATKSSSNDINSNSGGGNSNNSNIISHEADDSVADEYARHVARHTGAIPKQRSLAKIKQQKMKRASQTHQKTAPGAVEEGCLSGQAVGSMSGDYTSVSGDGRQRCSDGNGDDFVVSDVVRDTCSVDSEGKRARAEQPITLPLRQHNTPTHSSQF